MFNSNALVTPDICVAAGKWWKLDIFTLLVGTGVFPLVIHCSLTWLEILFQFNQILDGERAGAAALMLIDTRTGTTSDFLLPCCIIGRLSLKQLVSIMKVIRKLNELFARCVMLSIDKKRKIESLVTKFLCIQC